MLVHGNAPESTPGYTVVIAYVSSGYAGAATIVTPSQASLSGDVIDDLALSVDPTSYFASAVMVLDADETQKFYAFSSTGVSDINIP